MPKRKRANTRLRRAWAKPYSMRSMKTPNKEIMSGYSDRGASQYNAWLDRVFPGKQLEEERKGARPEMLQKLVDLVGEHSELNQTIIKGRYLWDRVFFSSRMDLFFIVSIDYFHSTYRKSITYGSRERAMSAYQNGEIVWKQVISSTCTD